jgi:hypothetical protein
MFANYNSKDFLHPQATITYCHPLLNNKLMHKYIVLQIVDSSGMLMYMYMHQLLNIHIYIHIFIYINTCVYI